VRKTVPLVLVIVLAGVWMMPGRASSHREAPLISGDPQVDNTDLWAFVSPADSSKVALISSWIQRMVWASSPSVNPMVTVAISSVACSSSPLMPTAP